jgi:hypothetical protein
VDALTLRDDEVVSQLNQAKYLYLRNLSEPRDNSLRIVVEEAVAGPSEAGLMRGSPSPVSEVLVDARPIESTDRCRAFELRWNQYVAYLVTEEMVGSGANDQDEVYTGNLLRLYTKSHFLDHLARDTGGHTQPILHYKLTCLNHLIDVASYNPPEVQLLPVPSHEGRTMPKPN